MFIKRKITAAERAPKVEAPAETRMGRIAHWLLATEWSYRQTQDRIHGDIGRL